MPTRSPTGLWINNYTGFETISYDASLGDITKIAGPRRSRSTRARSPSTATRSRRRPASTASSLAALANGGSADNIAPGVDLLQEPRRHRQPHPGRPGPGHDRRGHDPDRDRLDLQPAARRSLPSRRRASPGRSSSRPTHRPVAAYYNEAINKDAAHPAAARCWMEYVFSDAGQNTWLKGFALPVRLAAMQTAGTVDQAALRRRQPADDRPGPADAGPDRRGHDVPHRQLDVHLDQVARRLTSTGGAPVTDPLGRRAPSAIRGRAGPATGGAGSSRSRPSRRTTSPLLPFHGVRPGCS